MQKLFYPIFKLPDYYIRDYNKQELPLWIKYWLLGKSTRKLSEVLTGTYFELENSLSRKLKIKQIESNTFQETTQGYNIMNFKVNQNSKVTVNNDGTITINGKGGFNLNFARITLKAGETYKQKLEIVSGSINSEAYKDHSFMSFSGNSRWLSSSYYVSYTPSEDVVKNNLWVNESAVFTDYTIKIWGYKGTDNKEFEKYTGGLPAPNTDYEMPIKVVTEENIVKIENEDKTENQNYTINFGNMKLCKIPNTNYKDYLWQDENGEWYKHEVVEYRTLSSNDVYEFSSYWLDTYGVYGIGIQKSRLGISNSYNSIPSLCSKFRLSTGNASNNTFNWLKNIGEVFFFTNKVDNRDDAKALINGMGLLYKKDEETDIKITDQNLISQLNNFKNNAKSYNGKTYITVECEENNVPLILELQYWKEKGTQESLQLNYVNPEENPNKIGFIENDTLIPEDSINLDEIENDKSFLEFIEDIEESEENENGNN